MIVRSRDITVDAKLIKGVMEEFTKDVVPRLEKLKEAYAGKGAITKRTRSAGLPNNRLVHAYPRYIVTMASGYLVGEPVKYADDAQKEAVQALMDAYRHSSIDSVDAELAAAASTYGRGVCICYADEDGAPRAAPLSPMEAFVVYDDTVEHKPMFGVHWLNKHDAAGKVIGVQVHVHTAAEDMIFEGKAASSLGGIPLVKPHYFGGVPMVEFWNNAEETGDFEPVLSLIEAYDVLESDRVNDKQQFTDAVLLLTGCTLEAPEEIDEEGNIVKDPRTPAQRLVEERTLSLPDTEAKAEWLVKASDESGAETLRNAIKGEIHKMSMVPDLTDEHFAGNVSGVAMRYKLLGFEQLTKIKERWFREGLVARMKLFASFLSVLAVASLDTETVTITFTRALPVNETEIAAMVAQLSGIVPQRALLAQLPFIEDVDEAVAELEEEQEKAAKRQADAFGGQYLDGNEPPQGEEEDEEDKKKKRDDA